MSILEHLTKPELEEYRKCVDNLKAGDKIWIYSDAAKSVYFDRKTEYIAEGVVVFKSEKTTTPFSSVGLKYHIIFGSNFMHYATYQASDFKAYHGHELIIPALQKSCFLKFKTIDPTLLIARIEKAL